MPTRPVKSTYRVQLHGGLGLDGAAALADYLAELGVSHLYCSPYLAAAPGSTHGYDVVDHSRVDPAVGGEKARARLVRALAAHDLGHVLDIVPNHMAVESGRWDWFDVDPDVPGRYRRFFDVDGLAGIRVEDPAVFAEVHRRIAEWFADGSLSGVRVDHPDGLADPGGYFARLRALAGPDAWIVAEKILARGERLPASWPVDGTTGYDAAVLVTGLFVDPAAEEPLTGLYQAVTGRTASWPEVARDAKRQVVEDSFGPEVDRLVRICGRPREAIVDDLVAMPVYRTYDGGDEATVRFEQTSGAVMAKGVEDTAFYRYHRLVALNEVGGDPGRWGTTVADFHADCAWRQDHQPLGMTALSTHDTKRSEDVRARIAVLSWYPSEWTAAVRRWSARPRPDVDPNFAYLMYQTLVGAHPLPLDRAMAYAEKASREAKERTGWIDPDPAYDDAVRAFVTDLLGDKEFQADLAELVDLVDRSATVVTLAQKLVQLTMPGVPDVYQGTELPDYSLVDPDNRRPVDFDLRRKLLAVGDEPKLRVVGRALQLRRDRPALFTAYRPLAAPDHLLAFDRGGAVTVVPRLRGEGTSVELPEGRWRNVLTGEEVTGGDPLLTRFPVALLVSTDSGS